MTLTALGSVGLWSIALEGVRYAVERDALTELDEQGWPAIWIPEAFGREAMAHAALALAATKHTTIATGIANQWARDATTMANGAATLAEAFPGRFVLGIGVSHRGTAKARGRVPESSPLQAVRDYLDAMEAARYSGVAPAEQVPLVLAALGPKMLQIAAERTAGAHTYTAPVAHTAMARDVLGSGPLLAPELRVVLHPDPDVARATARASLPLTLPNYRSNLLRSGFSESDVDGGGSDRLVDAVVAWGDVDAVVTRVREHPDAGADHVCLQVLPTGHGLPMAEWRELAAAFC